MYKRQALAKLLGWPTIASKNWVYRQYDHMVRAGTAINPGSDAAVIRVKADSYPPLSSDASQNGIPDKYLAMSVDCNGAHVYLDPYEGGKATVAEAARNLVCSGARPLGATDNLNFGNPHNPELFWQLKESVRGLAEACEAFGTPVTGGNVSLYNQNPAGAIDPTPTVGMVGLVEKPEHITNQWFKVKETPSSCLAKRLMVTIRCSAWAARRCCKSSTASRRALRRRATWPRRARCTMRCLA